MRNGLKYNLDFEMLITGCCLELLIHLSTVPDARQRELEEATGATASDVYNALKFLKREELVNRYGNTNRITDKGRDAIPLIEERLIYS